jgi:guanylate kinase
VVARLLELDSSIGLSRSWTTRTRRVGEPEGASRAEFEELVAADGFLEWAEFLGNLYGTPKPADAQPADNGPSETGPSETGPSETGPSETGPAAADPPVLILEIDVQGARQIAENAPGALFIFVDAPSREDQASRLRQRGDDESHVNRRLAKADAEASAAAELGAIVVVNDDVDRCAREILSLIRDPATRHLQS